MKHLKQELAKPNYPTTSRRDDFSSEPLKNSHKPLRISQNLVFFKMVKYRGLVKNEKLKAVRHFEVMIQCDIQLLIFGVSLPGRSRQGGE